MNFNYNLKTPEERLEYVENLLENDSNFSTSDLSSMSNYILCLSDKDQTKIEKQEEHPILTKNREVTIKKRQVSYEEICSNLENGEDGIYALIKNDKHQILDPKERVSTDEIKQDTRLQEAIKTITSLQEQFTNATGKRKFALKKALIETWQQIYILKASLKNAPPRGRTSSYIHNIAKMSLDDEVTLDEDLMPVSNGTLSLLNQDHISFLLCYYPQLKQECQDNLQADMYYILLDLENLIDEALRDKGKNLYYDVLIWKIDGLTNEQIDAKVQIKYGESHTDQYYSTLWRQRIPKMLLEQAQKNYLIWYYTNIEKAYWKKCSRCGEIKLAHPMFFSHNSSKDGWYSICKECRCKKPKR